jgi:hypothetical protein
MLSIRRAMAQLMPRLGNLTRKMIAWRGAKRMFPDRLVVVIGCCGFVFENNVTDYIIFTVLYDLCDGISFFECRANMRTAKVKGELNSRQVDFSECITGADFNEETEGSQYCCERSSFGEEMGKRELSHTPDSRGTRPAECRKPNRFGC